MGKQEGYLEIGNQEDRVAVASLLFKNGYTVSLAKAKIKNNKSYTYFVKYSKETSDNQVANENGS